MSIYYRDEHVTLHGGDCLDVLAELPGNSVDSICTDPPYNLSFMAKPWDAYDGREDAGFAYWLAGLIDGEGCFQVKAHSRGTHAPAFTLKLRADEFATLERIKRTTGIGTITREDRGDANPMVKWSVQDKAGCQRLVDLLDKYPLRAKKRIDYWTWREAVCEWTSRLRGNRWAGGVSNDRMAVLRGQIMSNREYTEVPWSGDEFQDWCRLWAIECLRVLRPGGHMLAFGGTRTHHRLAAAIEDAGFEIRDSIAWLYGSGFPKSLDVSKAIDKAAGAEREVLSTGSPVKRMIPGADQNSSGSWIIDNGREFTPSETAPATDAARQWAGWGTALKPAFEPIVVARKPLAGTVAANVQAHGVGALNIDACRIGDDGGARRGPGDLGARGHPNTVLGVGLDLGNAAPRVPGLGRWPANVVLDGDMADELDKQSGTLTSGANPTRRSSDKFRNAYGEFSGQQECVAHRGAESGGAARFFPTFRYTAKAPTAQRPSADGVSHPTVKPLELMRWLIRLVTPPHGVVLDPFAGSGTTGEAAIHEHMRAILIERESTYLPLIVARLSKPMEVGFDFDPVGEHIAQTMFTRGGTAAYEPIPLSFDGEAPA